MELTLRDRVRRSAGPGAVLRALPSVLVAFTVATDHGDHRLPFPLIVALAAIVVISNGWLVLLRDGEPIGRSVYALLAFALAGSLLWFALPGSALIALPYWVARVAVRYHRPGPVEWVVVGIATVGATVPFYLASHSVGVAFGVIFGMAALVLASTNRRNRETQMEELEVSLARRQTALEEHGRAAALAERARIARDVHDVLAHSLAGLSLNLQGARLMLVRDGASAEAIEQVTRAQGLAADGLAEARRAVAALRDDSVPDERALADLVTAYRLESGATATFETSGTTRELPADVMNALYRTLQEALANTRKHALGAPVLATLEYGDTIRLSVEDQPGRRPDRAEPGGYGLVGMRERAELLGGSLVAGPTAQGWRVELKVPG
ncbi:sensor histidine kinase [Kribbella sp. NPDC051587]|uniref:sensor histidine kinase n=1 Tax=Kribbella sp. NPDC051587 TaxID=3364119 RepID=UPI0037961E6A